jgi:hypothetical protein
VAIAILHTAILRQLGGGSFNCAGGGFAGTFSGYCNAATGSYSMIGGGSCNTVSGAYSAILGGCGNTISAAYQYAGVFGCNVSAVLNNAFHTNCLVACSTSAYISGLPPGTISYLNATSGMVAIGFPLGSRIALVSP